MRLLKPDVPGCMEGIHIQDGDLRAREMGVQVAKDAWIATTELFTAEIDASAAQAF